MTSYGGSGGQLPEPGQIVIFNRSQYEDMRLMYPKPRLDLGTLKKQIKAVA